MTSNIRTFVVDDSPAALGAICSLVARQPNLLFLGSATNGYEALELAQRLQPDLVLLDLEMPVMSGLEVTARLRHDTPNTRIVIVTVHDTPRLRKLCLEKGAKAFIPKEELADQLPLVVRELFGNGGQAGIARG